MGPRKKTASGSAGALMFFALCASAQQPLDASNPPNYIKTADILYAVIDGRQLGLDLYMSNDVDNPPLLVWVHGGRWLRRTKEDVFTTALVGEGFAIASIDFRLSVDAPFPAQIHDIKAAIRFLRANATTYGYDATRIGIHGRSSGGHLTALVGVTNGNKELEGSVGKHLDQSSDVQAVVSYFGASNLTSILDQSTPFGITLRSAALALLLGGSLEQKMELAKLASPVFHVDATDPPLLLLHGDQDSQMPINQAHELHVVYKEHGLPVHFEVIHGAVHGSEEFFDQNRNALVTAFLKEHLR
jgi:acetyl esterase/lipase